MLFYLKYKMKICLIIHALSPGGMERVMSQLASHFSQKEHSEIHLVLFGIKTKKNNYKAMKKMNNIN